MKHNYDEPTMQAAIDAALPHTLANVGNFVSTSLDMTPLNGAWGIESHVRLHLLKTALDLLPEPPPPVVDGKTPGQVCHESMYNTPEWKWLLAGDKAACESAASAVLAAFGNKPAEIPWTKWHGGGCPLKDEQVEEWGCELRDGRKHTNVGVNSAYWRWQHLSRHDDIIAYRVTKWKEGFGPVDWKARAEKAEAELASATEIHHSLETIIGQKCLPSQMARFVSELLNSKPSTLRPIAEAAGKVPAGCVRYYFESIKGVGWPTQKEQDTHFTDIRLPEPKSPNPHPILTLAQDQIDATPAMQAAVDAVLNELIHEGGEMFQVTTAPWTPKVGDVVTLKSGGPKMTVGAIHKDEAKVFGFKDNSLVHAFVPTATLTKAAQ